MNLFQKQEFSELQIKAKAYAGKQACDRRDYSAAATYFNEYFEMKGYGKFPALDLTDFRMYLNLMLSQFYSLDYLSCIKTCEILIRLEPNASDAYVFSSMSYYKLNDKDKALKLWVQAKQRGNQITSTFTNIEDVKMQGFQ